MAPSPQSNAKIDDLVLPFRAPQSGPVPNRPTHEVVQQRAHPKRTNHKDDAPLLPQFLPPPSPANQSLLSTSPNQTQPFVPPPNSLPQQHHQPQHQQHPKTPHVNPAIPLPPPPFRVPTSIDNNTLHLLDFVGQGSFAHVYLARDDKSGSEEKVAVKCIAKKKGIGIDEVLKREVDALIALRGLRNVVEMKRVVEMDRPVRVKKTEERRGSNDSSDIDIADSQDQDGELDETEDSAGGDIISGWLMIVMEFCPLDLYEAIMQHGGLPDNTVRSIFSQLCDGIHHCHSRGYFHRDVKPENVVLVAANNNSTSMINTPLSSSPNLNSATSVTSPPSTAATPTLSNIAMDIIRGDLIVKLTDFGLVTRDTWSWEYGCGSSRYIPPEAGTWAADSKRGYSPAASDVWAVAVILVNLLFGKNPWFEAAPGDAIWTRFVTDQPDVLMVHFNITRQLNHILQRAFSPDPARRLPLLQLQSSVCSLSNYVGPPVSEAEAPLQVVVVPGWPPPSRPTPLASPALSIDRQGYGRLGLSKLPRHRYNSFFFAEEGEELDDDEDDWEGPVDEESPHERLKIDRRRVADLEAASVATVIGAAGGVVISTGFGLRRWLFGRSGMSGVAAGVGSSAVRDATGGDEDQDNNSGEELSLPQHNVVVYTQSRRSSMPMLLPPPTVRHVRLVGEAEDVGRIAVGVSASSDNNGSGGGPMSAGASNSGGNRHRLRRRVGSIGGGDSSLSLSPPAQLAGSSSASTFDVPLSVIDDGAKLDLVVDDRPHDSLFNLLDVSVTCGGGKGGGQGDDDGTAKATDLSVDGDDSDGTGDEEFSEDAEYDDEAEPVVARGYVARAINALRNLTF